MELLPQANQKELINRNVVLCFSIYSLTHSISFTYYCLLHLKGKSLWCVQIYKAPVHHTERAMFSNLYLVLQDAPVCRDEIVNLARQRSHLNCSVHMKVKELCRCGFKCLIHGDYLCPQQTASKQVCSSCWSAFSHNSTSRLQTPCNSIWSPCQKSR